MPRRESRRPRDRGRRTKTGRPRTLFFTEETAALMRRVWPERNPDDPLFAGKVRGQPIDYEKSWLDPVAAIGRPDLHQHDLRQHYAAELPRAGTTIAVAAQVLGEIVTAFASQNAEVAQSLYRIATSEKNSSATVQVCIFRLRAPAGTIPAAASARDLSTATAWSKARRPRRRSSTRR